MNLEYNFFTPEAVDQQFEDFLESLSEIATHTEVMDLLHKALNNRMIAVRSFGEESEPLTFWRISNHSGLDPKKRGDFAHPSSSKCSRQRANIAGYPVMYVASDPMTAIREMKKSLPVNTNFYLSKWTLNIKTRFTLHDLLLNSTTSQEGSPLRNLVIKQVMGLESMVKGLSSELRRGFVHSVKKLGDLFTTSSEDAYHITSAYAHSVLYGLREKGVIYRWDNFSIGREQT